MSQQPVPRDSEPPTASFGLSCKAFFWGGILSLGAAIGALHSTFVNASWMALNISVPIAFFVFALFAGLVNPLLGLVHRRLMLRRAELGSVFIMAMMAATVPTEGYVEHMVPKIASVFYYTTPENDWEDLIHPYMKGWFAPLDGEAVQHFFEGSPAGVPIPWGAWIQPLCGWALFFLTLCFVMVCTMVILRRQWIDHERLVYPLVKLPIEMIEEDGSLMRPFFRNPVMWLGFSIPFALLSLDALHSYYNFIPAIVLDTSIPVFRDLVSLRLALSFMTLGFAYFVNLQVLLSIWVFFLLTTAQQGLFSVLGIAMRERLTGYATSEAIAAHEGMGALIAFVLFSLWVGRDHLRAVCRKAFLGDAAVDDSGEMLSYRTAVFGTIIGLAILGAWLTLSGLPGWLVPWFLFVVFVLFVGLSRFVAEAGLATIRAPIYPQAFMTSTVGTTAIGAEGLAALGMTYAWILKVRIFAMAACANALKTRRRTPRARGRTAAVLGDCMGGGHQSGRLDLVPPPPSLYLRRHQPEPVLFRGVANALRGYSGVDRQPDGGELGGMVLRGSRRWGHGVADAGAALLFVVAAASGRLAHCHDLGYQPDLGERLPGVALQERGVEIRGAWIVQADSAIFPGIGLGQCGCGRRVVSNR